MIDWTSGYVADIAYTYGYYTELNPLRVKLAFLNNGLAFPDVGAACELGFGQGLSANIHAAASTVQWHGTDFNPSQAAFAQDLARTSGSNAKLLDDAFAEFTTRADLPDFDFIGLHGIWSWISDENRAVIVDFVRRKLKVGGVLYVSYNTMPGWAAFAPMRHLMAEHAEVIGSQGRGIVARVDDAIGFAERLLALNPAYSRANPQVAERIKTVKGQNRHYLAHEYFNRDWHPMHFATMARWLEPAKLQFACSADLVAQIDGVQITPEQLAFLNEIPDPGFRQSTRDFLINQQFRKDYWVKGSRRLDPVRQLELLREQRVLLTSPAAGVARKINTALGEAELAAGVYDPLLEQMADHKLRSIGQIEQLLAARGLNFAQVLQALFILVGIGHMAPALDEPASARSRKTSDRLNNHLQGMARAGGDISFLASPVTGGGIAVTRFEQLFLRARAEGHKTSDDWGRAVHSVLLQQGQRLVKDGKTLESAEENLAELQRQAREFSLQRLGVLKALQMLA